MENLNPQTSLTQNTENITPTPQNPEFMSEPNTDTEINQGATRLPGDEISEPVFQNTLEEQPGETTSHIADPEDTVSFRNQEDQACRETWETDIREEDNQPYALWVYPNEENGYEQETPGADETVCVEGEACTEPKPKARVGRKFLKAVAWVLVLAVAVSIGCIMTERRLNAYWGNRVEEMQYNFNNEVAALQQQIQELAEKPTALIGSNIAPGEALSPAQVYAMNVKSVVMIRSSTRMSYATGSGFIISEDGYVVTNHHVVEGGNEFAVITSDGTEYAAELVGSDNTNDVALLKVEAQGLQAAILGSSSDLVVGDQVAAIGNPLGELTSTLTVGYVSAMERDVNTEGFAINMLQTDAAINSGNSGGPLFNMRGEVVGITTAKYSGTSSSGATIEGVGFAIPIDDVKDLLSDLAAYGYVTGAFIGVRVSDMDPEAASYYGLPVGAYVQSTEPDGPAQQAGIFSKDIIVKVGDYDVRTVNDLTRALRNYRAGDVVTVVIYRGGGEMKIVVTLTEKPAN